MHLYKYLAPDRIDVLTNRLLRFTQPGDLNDPYEASFVFEAMIPPERLGALVDHTYKDLDESGELGRLFSEAVDEQLDQVLASLAALGLELPMSSDALRANVLDEMENLKGDPLKEVVERAFRSIAIPDHREIRQVYVEKYKEVINERVGVLCLSECWDNLLMWATYAAVHSGIVIGFESDDQYFHQPYVTPLTTEIQPVRYGSAIPRFRGIDPLGPPEQIYKLSEPFFFKGEEWAYEREWRLLRPLGAAHTTIPADPPTQPYPIHLMRWPEYAAREAIIGAKASADTREWLETVLAARQLDHVAIYEAVIHEEHRSVGRRLLRPPAIAPFWGERGRVANSA